MTTISISTRIGKYKNKKDNVTLEDKIDRIQNGDEFLRNKLLEDYQPFIKKITSKVCNRYINQMMDEFSIGLSAFNEAMDQYQRGQGSRFLTFADMVIRRRVIDYIRKEARQNKYIYLEPEELDEEGRLEDSFAEQKAALDVYEMDKQREVRMYEIEEYEQLLQKFSITFKVLSKNCPKHIDARDNAKLIAKLIAEDSTLSSYLLEKKQLPIKDLLSLVSCSRKTIERNRKYIIAVALIYLGGFNALKSYIQ
ncbi:RNA polymerase sigma-I factor [Guptibacillus algicola]|uniref:RNA polymerase sigma-I factor n=1 Tax=Guptibacillus algicola TaxID=225844 RepID=UPI001CD23CF3|nr:RNA polymerase sigma-I factor [Alkalihalobacillus algicola]MCA0986693.1 RNA polymerase sigma-I factor [Alkalihalobacillus algicola]